jgi:hypothetical protein
MWKRTTLLIFFIILVNCAIVAAQGGPCSQKSNKLACVIPQEYGPNAFAFTNVLLEIPGTEHPEHYNSGTGDIAVRLKPLTKAIGRQANLLPLASPSSGIIYDPSLKTFTGTDSLGPILGERAETVGRHKLFLGFSYQFFDFDKIDSVNLHNFPAVLTHTDDGVDNPVAAPPTAPCSINTGKNVGGCAFVRDLVSTVNSIDLKVNQYTSYITYGLTSRIDLSLVIPIENVRMSLHSNDTIILGTNGFYAAPAGSTDANPANPFPHFDHLFNSCKNAKPAAASNTDTQAQTTSNFDPACLNQSFPNSAATGGGSSPQNSASGIGDLVARVKWNALHGERAGFAAGLDVRFPSGDAVNYLGSGSYGVKPFAVFSYRARISPHVLVGYEWNSDSTTAADLTTNAKGSVPNDFVYSAGADALVTKWLTGSFDVIGQRFFSTETLTVQSQQFLDFCGRCTSVPSPNTVSRLNLTETPNTSYNITNASMGIKVRPLPSLSKLVVTANVLVRLDEGGLHSKPAPLVGLGYTF